MLHAVCSKLMLYLAGRTAYAVNRVFLLSWPAQETIVLLYTPMLLNCSTRNHSHGSAPPPHAGADQIPRSFGATCQGTLAPAPHLLTIFGHCKRAGDELSHDCASCGTAAVCNLQMGNLSAVRLFSVTMNRVLHAYFAFFLI